MENLDFVNTDRMTLQAIQELWRYGTLYFNYMDHAAGRFAYYQNTPNEYFVPAYGSLSQEVEDRGGIFESKRRSATHYASGYENFLMDATVFFWTRGQRDKAAYWYNEARVFTKQNVHDTWGRLRKYEQPLEDFMRDSLHERFASPHVAAGLVTGAIQGSFSELLAGDTDRFHTQFGYAADVHRYFHSEQFMEVVADGGSGNARMEVLDRDFPFIAGNLFAQTLLQLPPDEAVTLYNYGGVDLQRYAYDAIKSLRDAQIAAGQQVMFGDEEFAALFPEPDGMARHRQYIAYKQDLRSERALENINRQ